MIACEGFARAKLDRRAPAVLAGVTVAGEEESVRDLAAEPARHVDELREANHNGPRIREHSLTDPNIDIVSSHHYGPVARTLKLIDENVHVIRHRKRYFIGEFGLLSAKDTERVLKHALSRDVEGILLWSLRFHDRDGGFYFHMEKPPFQAYHFPGFLSGHDYEEQPIVHMMRRLAFELRGLEVPVPPVPATPSLLPVRSPMDISWRGSAGASYYVVEREMAGTGKWQVVGNRVDE